MATGNCKTPQTGPQGTFGSVACNTKKFRMTFWCDPLHREECRRGDRGRRAHRHPLLASLPGRGHTVTPACATLTCTNDQHIGAAQVVVAQGDALCHHLCPPLCLKSLCHHQKKKKKKSNYLYSALPWAGRDRDNCSSVINQLG